MTRLWLSEDEAVNHILSRHFSTFYQAERIADRTAARHLHVCRANAA